MELGAEALIDARTFAVQDTRIALNGRDALPVVSRDELLSGYAADCMVQVAAPEDVPGQLSIWPAYIAHLLHGMVAPDPFSVFDYQGRGLEESISLNVADGSERLASIRASNEGKPVVELAGWYICLANWSHSVYFHWFAQCLSSVELIEQFALPAPFRLLVPRLNSWQRDSLFELGFAPAQILEVDEGSVYACEHLLYPSDLQNQPSAISSRMVSICRRLRARVTGRQIGPWPKVYLSRLDAPHRVLTDEGALIDQLRSRGYQTLIPSIMSFRDEIAAFAGARIIVGTVGSGMTNLAFADPGAQVVLINCRGTRYRLYEWLAQRCGLKAKSLFIDRPQTARDGLSPWNLGAELSRVLAEVETAERQIGM